MCYTPPLLLPHSGCAEKQILVGEQCSVTQPTLDSVQAPVASEGVLCPGREASTGLQALLHVKRLRLLGGNMDLLVALLRLAEGAARQLAALVGHEVAAITEGQVLQIKHFARTQLEGEGVKSECLLWGQEEGRFRRKVKIIHLLAPVDEFAVKTTNEIVSGQFHGHEKLEPMNYVNG